MAEIHIPDSVGCLCDDRFGYCKSLSHFIFGESFSLKLVGKEVFRASGLKEISIPASVAS